MAGQDKVGQPLTPDKKSYDRLAIVILIATGILIAGFFAMMPLLGNPARTDDLLAMIAGFVVLEGAVIMIALFTLVPRDPDLPRRRLSHLMAIAAVAASLFLPVFGHGWIDPRLNFAIILVLLAASVWLERRIWRVSDELDRRIMMETYAGCCLVLFAVLIVYATGERLGLFGGVTAWGALAFATLASFPIAIWVTVRRGGMVESPDDEPSAP